MTKENKKEIFKILIQEFQELSFPEVIKRDLEVPLNIKKIITVFGPRRSGKTFYLHGLIKKLLEKKISKDRILYLSFEDDRILPLDFSSLNDLMEAYFELYPENKKKEIFLFFDEIQNIENWELFIRRIHDKERVKIFITGSSSKLLSREIATHLRGRTISFALPPLSFQEFLRFKQESLSRNFEYGRQKYKIIKLLEEYLQYGGFPEVVLTENISIKNSILKEYFDLLIYRDLAERFSIKNTQLLKDMLKYLFTNITSLFSTNSYYKNIKQSLPLSRETIYDYLGFIKETGYFSLFPCFSYSLKEQKVNLTKIISLDNGLRNRIGFKFSQDLGKLAENLVGSILSQHNEKVYYWKNKQEVDFVTINNNNLQAINVCFGIGTDEREINSLLEFKKRFKKADELVIISKDIDKTEGGIKFIPLYKWLLEI